MYKKEIKKCKKRRCKKRRLKKKRQKDIKENTKKKEIMLLLILKLALSYLNIR